MCLCVCVSLSLSLQVWSSWSWWRAAQVFQLKLAGLRLCLPIPVIGSRMLLTIQTLQTFTYKDDHQEKYDDDEDDRDSYDVDGDDNEDALKTHATE